MALKASHQPLDILFVVFPLLAIVLDLHLRLGELLVEFFEVVLGVKHFAVFSDLLE